MRYIVIREILLHSDLDPANYANWRAESKAFFDDLQATSDRDLWEHLTKLQGKAIRQLLFA